MTIFFYGVGALGKQWSVAPATSGAPNGMVEGSNAAMKEEVEDIRDEFAKMAIRHE